jgi:protocatechuate 3,4-dioxygenase beta subunit
MLERDGISRRGLLGVLAKSGAVLLVGCGSSALTGTTGTGGTGGTGGAGGTSTTGTGGAGGSSGGSCAVTPEGEVGPYFTDDSAAGYNRSNIVANIDGTEVQEGIPLTLTITVVDTEKSCAPYVGAQIDIWHCNASGVYSNESVESTLGKSWLRGYQITNAKGQVTFTTVIPGWYSGRTTHIHVRVRSSHDEAAGLNDGTNTTQLFIAQTLIDTIDTTVAPYEAEGTNPTTNAGDRVYAQETGGTMQMTLVGDNTNGYTASAVVRLPITQDYDAGAGMGAGGGMGGPPDGGMGGPPDGGGGGP